MPPVFISYSHDNDEHRTRVAALAKQLRELGIAITLDADKLPTGGPEEGWPAWSERQVVDHDKVLVACTERYCRSYETIEPLGQGLGAACEARAIRQILYENNGINPKFRVILWEREDANNIPINLRPYHRYELWREESKAELIAWLRPSVAPITGAAKQVQWPALDLPRPLGIADRDAEFGCFEAMLKGPTEQRILLIRAERNRGKTALMREFHDFVHAADVTHCLVDLKGSRAIDSVLDDLALDAERLLCGLAKAGPAQRQGALLRDLQELSAPLVLAFDTYEQSGQEFAYWLEGRILSRVDRFPALRIVVAGQEVPEATKSVWAPFAATFDLPPISEEEHWYDFSRRSYADVPEQILTKFVPGLILATGGNPGAIGNLLKELATRYSNAGRPS